MWLVLTGEASPLKAPANDSMGKATEIDQSGQIHAMATTDTTTTTTDASPLQLTSQNFGNGKLVWMRQGRNNNGGPFKMKLS